MNLIVIINDETSEVRVCLVDENGELIEELDSSKFTVNITDGSVEESTKFNISLI